MCIYKETVITRPHEAGRDKRLRMQSICNYFEDAAGYHADELGCGLNTLLSCNQTWVLAKMRFLFHRRPIAGSSIELATWPVRVEKTQFRRDFTVTTKEGEKLVSATTYWVIINLSTRRIEKMPSWAHDLVPDKPSYALDDTDIKFPSALAGASGPSFPVRLADIDQNNHVNNVRYVDFCLEATERFLLFFGGKKREACGFDLIFRAESLMGDTINTFSLLHPENTGAIVHSFTRQTNGQELARACVYIK